MTFDYPADLRFKCAKCGLCCGDTKEKNRRILILNSEAEQIATATSQPIARFTEKINGEAPYTYEVKKANANGKCVFLKDKRCTIYPLRPLICRFYPFELKVAASGRHQFVPTTECPSIGKGKRLEKTHFDTLFQLARVKMRKQPKPKKRR